MAIALTLLVLQLRVPVASAVADSSSASDLASALGREGDQFLSYLVAFYVIAQFWLAHHRVFRQMSGHHEGLAWWNFAFLLTITLIPFTSDLLGQYASNPLAIDIFALNLLLASLTSTGTLVFARRRGLVTAQLGPTDMWRGLVRSGSLAVAVVLSIAVSWVNTGLAKYCWLLIAVLPLAARRFAPPSDEERPAWPLEPLGPVGRQGPGPGRSAGPARPRPATSWPRGTRRSPSSPCSAGGRPRPARRSTPAPPR